MLTAGCGKHAPEWRACLLMVLSPELAPECVVKSEHCPGQMAPCWGSPVCNPSSEEELSVVAASCLVPGGRRSAGVYDL